MKPKIGDSIIFVTCSERAVIHYFVRDIAVCSSNQCGMVLVPVEQIHTNHRKESKSWRANIHYHFDIYDVAFKNQEREGITLDIGRPGRDFAENGTSAKTIAVTGGKAA